MPAEAIQDGIGFDAPRIPGPPTTAGPMADGKIVTEDAGVIYRSGGEAEVPFMIGANTADLGGFGGAKALHDVFKPFGANAAQAQAVYDPDHTGDVSAIAARVGRDAVRVQPARFLAATLTAQGHKAWIYHFGYVVDAMRDTWKTGTPHAKEIPFVFHILTARYATAVAAHDADVAKAAHAYRVHFGKAGNPNGAGLPVWPAYAADTDELMTSQPDGVALGQKDPRNAQLDLAAQRAEAPGVHP